MRTPSCTCVAAAAISRRLSASSTTSINSLQRPTSAMRRSILRGPTTGEVSRNRSSPAAARASASDSLAQQRPSAPWSICSRPRLVHLWVLAWGLRLIPCDFAQAVMAARLASRASRSSTRAGVVISRRLPGRPRRSWSSKGWDMSGYLTAEKTGSQHSENSAMRAACPFPRGLINFLRPASRSRG